MYLGIHFDSLSRFCAPVPSLLFILVSVSRLNVEMKAREQLFSLIARRKSLKSFVRVHFLVGEPPALDFPPYLENVLVRFL